MIRTIQALLCGSGSVGGIRSLVRLWNHDFHDVRIILEQRDELQYFSITRQFQRLIVRVLMASAAAAGFAIVALMLVATGLQLEKWRLETSHQEIYIALLGASQQDVNVYGVALRNDEMLMLAQTISERDLEVRRFVHSATASLASENQVLQSQLDASGLTTNAIKVIQSSSPIGGLEPEPPRDINPILKNGFSENSARNRELKEVLSALPGELPVKEPRISSTFGIRNHPVHGSPRFHTGVDLVSNNGDDRVFPAKRGKVVMASSYHAYGNTVIVRHERGIETLYAHLESIAVHVGQDVDLNTVLGEIGNTGVSTGKHLHFEVSVGGFPVDPLKVISTAKHVHQAQE